MHIQSFITTWLTASNNFDTKNYLAHYHTDAILDDPSVGNKFKGHKGIQHYFDTYFIGYNTQTKLLKLTILSPTTAHLTVSFLGDFPEGQINGTFAFTFREDKIAHVKADLLH